MKRIALAAAIFVLAACSRGETPATDTTTPAMAPAPAMDTMRMDTTKSDTMMTDSAKAATKTP